MVQHVVEALRSPPRPKAIELTWGRPQRRLGVEVTDGVFESPVDDGTLPQQSRIGRVRLLLPAGTTRPDVPICLHLAATGEQSYKRRLALAWPLLSRGIGALLLENPLYGQRRPPGQVGVGMRHVADLMTMGRAAVEEARGLLLSLRASGHTKLGVSGFSMGGQLAALTGALLDFPMAIVPVAAPSSAKAVFIDGLLRRAPAWSALAGHEELDAVRSRLVSVLEASDVTLQPPPRAPEAAILLAAQHDGYVAKESAARIHHHWPGSEMRWMPGGHVSGYVGSARHVRAAIEDAFTRLPVG